MPANMGNCPKTVVHLTAKLDVFVKIGQMWCSLIRLLLLLHLKLLFHLYFALLLSKPLLPRLLHLSNLFLALR